MTNVQIQISWLLKKPTDLDLHCLQNRVYPGSAGQGLIENSSVRLQSKVNILLWYSWGILHNMYIYMYGAGWLVEPMVSCSFCHWCWLKVGQGLLSLQQVRVERDVVISSVPSLSFISLFLPYPSLSSTISSVCFLPFTGRQHKMIHKVWRVVKPQRNQNHLHEWSFYMKFIKWAFGEFKKFHM